MYYIREHTSTHEIRSGAKLMINLLIVLTCFSFALCVFALVRLPLSVFTNINSLSNSVWYVCDVIYVELAQSIHWLVNMSAEINLLRPVAIYTLLLLQ